MRGPLTIGILGGKGSEAAILLQHKIRDVALVAMTVTLQKMDAVVPTLPGNTVHCYADANSSVADITF